MHKKILVCTILILSILVAGCGKTELEAVETVNVTFNAGLTGNPELAKGTTVEEDVTIFTVEMDNQIRSLLKNVFKIDNKAILSDDEFERMVYAYHKLLAKSKIDVKYNSTEGERVYIKAEIQMPSQKETTDYILNVFRNKCREDNRGLLFSFMDENEQKKASIPYLIEAYEEAADKDFLLERTNDMNIACIYNEEKKTWELMNSSFDAFQLVRMVNYFHFK